MNYTDWRKNNNHNLDNKIKTLSNEIEELLNRYAKFGGSGNNYMRSSNLADVHIKRANDHLLQARKSMKLYQQRQLKEESEWLDHMGFVLIQTRNGMDACKQAATYIDEMERHLIVPEIHQQTSKNCCLCSML